MRKYDQLIRISITIIFITIIFLPVFQMQFKIFNTSQLNENRTRAQIPSLSWASIKNGKFMTGFQKYFNDNFGFRDVLITTKNRIDLEFFKTSSNPSQVIVGKNGYYYISESINDYDKITVSDEKIKSFAQNLYEFQKDLNDRGIDFLYFFGPNKNSIYPEFMPRESKNKNELSNCEKLLIELDRLNVNYIDLASFLRDQKENKNILKLNVLSADSMQPQNEKYELYYKLDTHWNEIASVLVTGKILDKLGAGENKPQIHSLVEDVAPRGDLSIILGVDYLEKSLFPKVDINNQAVKLPKAVFYHDSFGERLFPYLKPYFSEMKTFHISHQPLNKSLDYESLTNAKLVIFEHAERSFVYNYDFKAIKKIGSPSDGFIVPENVSIKEYNPRYSGISQFIDGKLKTSLCSFKLQSKQNGIVMSEAYIQAYDSKGKIQQLFSLPNNVKDEVNIAQKKLYKRIEKEVFDGSKDYAFYSNGSGFKRICIPYSSNPFLADIKSADSYIIYKDNGVKLETLNSKNADSTDIWLGNMMYITIPNEDSGWSDTYVPSNEDIKNYFVKKPYIVVYQLAQEKVYENGKNGFNFDGDVIISQSDSRIIIEPWIRNTLEYSKGIHLDFCLKKKPEIIDVLLNKNVDSNSIVLEENKSELQIKGAKEGNKYIIEGPILLDEYVKGQIEF